MSEWRKSEVWKSEHGSQFTVEIVHWYFPARERSEFYAERKEMWNLYAYIYPEHPLFEKFRVEADDWDQHYFFDFHGGVTFCRAHYSKDGSKIVAWQIGCDYAHVNDEYYEQCVDVSCVLGDAETLFEALSERVK